jgi:hypothetical protein
MERIHFFDIQVMAWAPFPLFDPRVLQSTQANLCEHFYRLAIIPLIITLVACESGCL